MNQPHASAPTTDIFEEILAGISREFTRWATEDLAKYTLEQLSSQHGEIDETKWVQLGFTPKSLDEAYEELSESGQHSDLTEYACDYIVNELNWNYDKILYDQLKQVAVNGFAAKDIALWRTAYGWSNHSRKLLARADRLSDALHPRNATVDLNEAVRISSGGRDMGPDFAKLIESARAKYNEA